MNESYNDPEFEQIVAGVDPEPYGPNPEAAATPKKTGLNSKGKAVLGAAGVVLAVGGFLVYQDHQENVAAQETKQAEIALKQQQLDIERLKVTNAIDEKQAEREKDAEKSVQAKVETCVAENKEHSAYLQGVVDACKEQYNATAGNTDGDDMAQAGATLNSGGSGGINPMWAVAGLAGAGGIAYVAKRVRRDPEPTYY